LTVKDVSTLESVVLKNAGARPLDRDAVDERIAREVATRTGRIIDSPSQVGGWPTLVPTYRALTLPANPNGDDDGNGYTNIEELLYQLSLQLTGTGLAG
jgi:hypothetical protein